MAQGQLWATLRTAIDPLNAKAMPIILQSAIDLLETELANARAALQAIQAQPASIISSMSSSFLSTPSSYSSVDIQDSSITAGAMAAYKHHLIGQATLINNPSICLPCRSNCPVAFLGKPLPTSLLDILSNSLILDHLAPYLSISSLLSLASTCTTLRSIIMDTPYVFRYMDLTKCRGSQPPPSTGPIDPGGETWRTQRMDESLTEDEFYGGPLRGIFSDLGRRNILQDVRTLVLDGLSVPADLIADIILTDKFNVVILSIRDCLNLNERKLMQTLQYAVRPSRAKGMPRVKGIYHFTPMDDAQTAFQDRKHSGPSQPYGSSELDDNAKHQGRMTWRHPWYKPTGKVLKKPISTGWAQTLQLCNGIISFDAVLCRSPQHQPLFTAAGNAAGNDMQPVSYFSPAIATVALGPSGCEGCHSSPEGPAVWNHSPNHQFPLLTPPPMHSSRVTAAKSPAGCSNVPRLPDQPLVPPVRPVVVFHLPPQPRKANTSSQAASNSVAAHRPFSTKAKIAGNVVLHAALVKWKFNGSAQPARESIASNTMTAAPLPSATGAIRAPEVRELYNSIPQV
ncbi:hypothetical protein PABG_01918 [Paracoccidioides brasiliensis Pb03]|nr:hypothetical protein PABG_01918 [Paracoccidioides brasiliensis Pb03]